MTAWDAERMYMSAVLNPKYAIPPNATTRRESLSRNVPVRPENSSNESPPTTRSTTMPRESPPTERNGHADVNGESSLDPLVEAESLRIALVEAVSRVGRLISALRGFRKQHKTVSSALASLRSLKLE